MELNAITKPTLLVDESRCRANIKKMAEKAHKNNLRLKPHMKTHQSAIIGEWLQDEGVQAITVSSVDMAEYFAEHGWRDITIAFPVNIREINRINVLAEQVTLTLLVVSEANVNQLSMQLNHNVQVYIEIDTGSDRSGFKVADLESIQTLVQSIQKEAKLSFAGFYSHPGHSYASRNESEIRQVHQSVYKQMQKLRTKISSADHAFNICIGDTPCCSKGTQFDIIDEISPGNFVFYDLMQTLIGSCKSSHIAVALAAPVVAKYPSRNEIVVHGGAIHLSKDNMQKKQHTSFGEIVPLNNNGWNEPYPGCYVSAISQEHGIIWCSDKYFDEVDVGDLVGILPVHSCLTANCMGYYMTLEGEDISVMDKEKT